MICTQKKSPNALNTRDTVDGSEILLYNHRLDVKKTVVFNGMVPTNLQQPASWGGFLNPSKQYHLNSPEQPQQPDSLIQLGCNFHSRRWKKLPPTPQPNHYKHQGLKAKGLFFRTVLGGVFPLQGFSQILPTLRYFLTRIWILTMAKKKG